MKTIIFIKKVFAVILLLISVVLALTLLAEWSGANIFNDAEQWAVAETRCIITFVFAAASIGYFYFFLLIRKNIRNDIYEVYF